MRKFRRFTPSPQTFWWWVLGLGALGLAIRVGFVLVEAGNRPIIGDARAYYRYGQSIAEGAGMVTVSHADVPTKVMEPVPTAQLPPLFSYFLALLQILGISSIFAQKLALAVAGSITPVLLGGAGRELGGPQRGPLVGVVAAGLAAVYPMLWMVDGSLMSETLVGVLLAGMLWVAVHARSHPTAPWFAAGGVLAGLAALTRGESLLLGVLIFAIIAIGTPRNWLRRLSLIGAFAAACLVVVLPWTIRNLTVFEEPVLIATNTNSVFAGANCDRVYRGDIIGLWDINCFGEDPPGDESQQAVEYRRRAVSYARDNVDRLPFVGMARVGRLWSLYQVPQQTRYDNLEGRIQEVTVAGLAMYYPLALIAVGGAVVLARRDRVLTAALLSVPAALTLVALAVYGTTRFRYSAEPVLVLLASIGLVALLEWVSGRSLTTPRIRPAAPDPSKPASTGPASHGGPL